MKVLTLRNRDETMAREGARVQAAPNGAVHEHRKAVHEHRYYVDHHQTVRPAVTMRMIP